MNMQIDKKQVKQKQIIYLSKKIEFKKQSQTIETVIKDKEIEAKKKVILNLLKTHANVSDLLANTKQVYKQEKQVYEQKYSQLIQEHSTANSCVLKLKVRKYRLQAIQKPELRHYFGNQVKNYLRSWTEYNKHILAKRLGGIENLEIARRMLWRLEALYYVKPQYHKIIYLKQIKVMNENCKLQSAILCIKKPNQEKQKVLLQIYATSGKCFHITRLIDTSTMHSKITKKNPLQNLLISIKRKQILFLSQYFLDPQNVLKIERVLKICKFQMDVLREKKKLVLYKRLKITNIFESIYHIRGYEGLELEVLLSVKKKEVVREAQETSSLYSNGMSRRMNKYGKEKALRQSQERVQTVYTLRCQTILQKDKQYRFCIQDDKILQSNDKNFSNFSQTFKQDFLIQLLPKPTSNNEQQQLIKDNHNNNNEYNNSSMEYGPPSADRKAKPKIVKVIDFEECHNLRDIITVQSFIKMNLCRKKYRNQIALFKKNRLFDFCCQVENNMMISAYIKGEQVRFFVQCLSLSSERRRQANQDLRYNKKYWCLAQQFMNSDQIMRIRQKYLIWEIEEQISTCFEEVIENYEKQQVRLNEMKPIKAINRLHKFFIKSFLKRKRKTNIIYIKKVQKQHGSLVLILRRSQYLKNITEAHLYYLQKSKKQKQRPQSNYLSKLLLQDSNNISNKRMRDSQKIENKVQRKKKISCQQNIELEEEKKNQYRYHKISMFNQDASNLVRYFHNRANLCAGYHINAPAVDQQFYITEEYFLLKPLHLQFVNCQYKFLDRFGKINVNCEQIMNELQNLSMQRTGGVDSRVMQDKIRRTLIKQRSMLKPSKKSTASINMQESEKYSTINQCGQNEKKDELFYSLYKNKKEIFCIEIFVIISTSTSTADKGYRFEQVHFQEISKKQVINFGFNVVYKIVALWLHQSGQSCYLDQLKFGKLYPELANHSIGTDGLDCFMAADAIDDQGSSQHDNDT